RSYTGKESPALGGLAAASQASWGCLTGPVTARLPAGYGESEYSPPQASFGSARNRRASAQEPRARPGRRPRQSLLEREIARSAYTEATSRTSCSRTATRQSAPHGEL